MKKIIMFFGAILMASAVNAQINVGANLLYAIPSGDWGGETKSAIGFGVEGNYFVMDNLSVGAEVGFYTFKPKEQVLDEKATITPISVKAEYYFLEDEFRPFVGLGIGYDLVNLTVTVPFFGEQKTKANGVGFSPRIGALYSISDLIDLCLNIQYNIVTGQDNVVNPSNFLAIGLGARFNIVE